MDEQEFRLPAEVAWGMMFRAALREFKEEGKEWEPFVNMRKRLSDIADALDRDEKIPDEQLALWEAFLVGKALGYSDDGLKPL